MWTCLAFLFEGGLSTQDVFRSRLGGSPGLHESHAQSLPVSTFMAPTGLLSHRGDRRPGWGRDYGPDLGLPKHVVANPFGDDTTPPPLSQPVAEQMEPTATPTAAPQFNHTRTVHNPDKEPELSATDQTEKAKHAATGMADAINPYDGMPDAFPGSNCEDVCAACEITKVQLKAGCQCSAKCIVGSIGGKCGADRSGWSDNRHTEPYAEWTGTCSNQNKFEFECSSCLSQDFKYEMGNCTNAGSDEAMCLHKLQQELAMNTGGRTFCFYKDLPSCQEFPKIPKPDDKDDTKWYCFENMRSCQIERAKMSLGEDERVWDYQTKSVWKQIMEQPGIALR